ncbi:hypothetical protein PBY51_009852 [Eleginops maclovinus]|uniref:Uncharacterized protein n=1 Tax=Eleginops maclovinus TaxID=56733 RepID=A0AAN7XRU6_ELEMC|nr:hypothetical protein PBY51_009852 [Eleginops maclovinus]
MAPSQISMQRKANALHAFHYSGGHEQGACWGRSLSLSADGGHRGGEVHLNKWIAWRDTKAQTLTHFSSGDGVSKAKHLL